jgi:DNA polymerase I
LEIFRFWLLDIWYEVHNNKPIVYLSGFDDTGQKVILADDSQRPFFFAKTFKHTPTDEYLKENSFKPKRFQRIYTQLPGQVPEEASYYRDDDCQTYSNDIYFTVVYSIEKGFVPCSWHDVKFEYVGDKSHLDFGFTIIQCRVKRATTIKGDPPKLSPLTLDIECYNPDGGMPNADVDPIIVMGLKTDKEQTVLKAKSETDFRLLDDTVGFCLEQNPNAYITYNGNDFDWDYITTRCDVNGLDFPIGFDASSPFRTEYGTIGVNAHPAIDVYGYARHVGSKRKTLYRVHEWMHKNKMVPERKYYEIDRNRIAYMWDNGQQEEVLKHCESDITCAHDIAKAVIPFAIALSRISKVPIDQCLSVPEKVLEEHYLFRIAHKNGYIIPNSDDHGEYPTKGAVVLPPVKGLHHNVAVFDFKSMHPNLAVKNNISFETYANGKWIPEPKGMMTIAMEELLEDLAEAKKQFKTKYSSKYSGEIQAIKTITRAMCPHAYLGYRYARWYSRIAKEEHLRIVRKTLFKTTSFLRSKGLKVIYGDTDSLFVPMKSNNENLRKAICRLILNHTGMEADSEFYSKVFFTEAKKKYIYLDESGEIHFVGFENARGDWSPLATRTQDKVAKIVMREEDIDKAVKFTSLMLQSLPHRPLKDFVIMKHLSKPIEEYAGTHAHVEIAKRHGVEIDGAIEYVVVNGDPKSSLASRARHPSEVKSLQELDLRYYRENQIKAAAGRILSYFVEGFDKKVKGEKNVFENWK